MIRLARPQFDLDEISAVVEVLQGGNLVQGAQVQAFEAALATYLGVKHAIACSSGTAALHLAVLALDLSPSHEIIVPTYTFPATANVIERSGARVRLVDVDPHTFNMDPAGLEAAINERTRAVMPVHLFGLCADMPRLLQIADANGLTVIEDAACALGSEHPDETGAPRLGGSVGAMACWSFHPRKVITTGEGGMVTTDDDDLADKLRVLRSHGATAEEGKLVYRTPGLNYRLTEMQGALGVGQMRRLPAFLARRRALAAVYDEALAGCASLQVPARPPGFAHAFQAYVSLLDPAIDRDGLIPRLRARGVETSIGTYALHEQPYYQERYDIDPDAFPGGTLASQRTLALPLHPAMSDDDARSAAAALREELER